MTTVSAPPDLVEGADDKQFTINMLREDIFEAIAREVGDELAENITLNTETMLWVSCWKVADAELISPNLKAVTPHAGTKAIAATLKLYGEDTDVRIVAPVPDWAEDNETAGKVSFFDKSDTGFVIGFSSDTLVKLLTA